MHPGYTVIVKRKTIREDGSIKRYFIEEAKCGITDGGMACGPVSGNVVATVRFNDGTASQWLNLVEVDGIPNVCLSDRDIYDDLLAEDYEDEAFTAYVNNHLIQHWNGIDFDFSYSTTLESMASDPENPAVPLIRYLLALVRCSMDDTEALIATAAGKYEDELDIPLSDIEEDFMDEEDEDTAEDTE